MISLQDTRVDGKISFPRCCSSHKKRLYASPLPNACLGFLTKNHHGQLSVTLSLGLVAVRDGPPSSITLASCELRSVIRFSCAKNPTSGDIHSQPCEVYQENCISIHHVREWTQRVQKRAYKSP